MKRKESLIAAVIIGGSLGLTLSPTFAQDRPASRSQQLPSDRPADRYPTKPGDEQALPPGVPGVTEENNSGMSKSDIMKTEEALQANGLNPGKVDGVIDNDTRAAIREFQKQNSLTVTESVDSRTAQALGITLRQNLRESSSSERPKTR
ncbi:MAG TPA: peptidoglycan-binding domain-containing protein [Terriglobales bacterium]|jgi:peptidoglycan hydrolase-like protein with peptidoglycan-binding domain|nr:peptidoglycan-binding domain-containing protein [Terriglobales bacterium]